VSGCGSAAVSDKGVITLEGPNRTTLISLLEVSDDAVMFLDRSGNLLVGNASFQLHARSAAKEN
jgi:hypothetical protein